MKKRNLSYELVTRISKQYSSRFEFQKGDKAAYNKALKEGWIDSYSWLGIPIRKRNNCEHKIHIIYAYLDEVNKTVYVGRTNNLRHRHSQHNRLSHKYKTYDVVKRHFMSIGILDKLPDPLVLETDLTLIESQEKEEYYVNKYKNEGWKILNTAKTGVNVSSTGSFVIKWTYEECKKIALTCKNRKEFEKKSSPAYLVSKRNGWIDEWLPISSNYHQAEYKWTKRLCVQVARQYTSLIQFSTKEQKAYYAAKRHGWLNEFVWLKRAKIENITQEDIVQLAKTFQHASDFKKEYPSHYHKARKLGILQTLGFVPKDTTKWTYEACKAEAEKYSCQIEFRKASPVAYNISLKNKWINDWLPKTILIRSDEELLNEARIYININDLRKKNDSLYCLLLKRGLLKQTGLGYSRQQWDEEKIREVASNYTSRYAFQKIHHKTTRTASVQVYPFLFIPHFL